jgi:hypothetical protein
MPPVNGCIPPSVRFGTWCVTCPIDYAFNASTGLCHKISGDECALSGLGTPGGAGPAECDLAPIMVGD